MNNNLNLILHLSQYAWPIALLVVCGSVWLLSPLSIRLGLVDKPGGRKQHEGQIPLIGGIAMFIGFAFAVLTLNVSLQPLRSFIAACAILVFVGVLDDFHELSARARFAAQIFAALFMTLLGHNILYSFGNLLYFGDIPLGIFAIPITIFAVVGVINAVNMTDGMDGLAGSLALVEFILLAILAYQVGDVTSVLILVIMVATLLGFLAFNFPLQKKAKIFMGDAGSMFIGFVLAWFLVSLSQGSHPAARPVTMLYILAIPLFDTTWLLIKRSWQYHSPFKPGRDHLHHLLQLAGWNNLQISLFMSFSTLILGLLGILGGYLNISAGDMFVSYLGLFICYASIMAFCWKRINIESI